MNEGIVNTLFIVDQGWKLRGEGIKVKMFGLSSIRNIVWISVRIKCHNIYASKSKKVDPNLATPLPYIHYDQQIYILNERILRINYCKMM